MSEWPVLSGLTLIPLIGGLLLLGLNREQQKRALPMALAFAFTALGLAVGLWRGFEPAVNSLQFVERREWIPSLGVEYFLGIDGLSLLLVLLTALLVPMALFASSSGIQEKSHLYFSLILFLQAGLFGTFTALNFFHWFIFWELSLVPAFFLIKLWGGVNRSFAATQFFIYTMVGSIAMLLGFMAIVSATGTFDFIRLGEAGRSGQLASALARRLHWAGFSGNQLTLLIFLAVFLGFAVKVPLIPFHIWLPITYAEAPTGTTMLLTGVMSKMGVYGFIRILMPLFPEQMRALLTPLLWLAVATIIFSAFAAFAQRDLKRLFAYSSINHLGYCLLGVFAVAKFSDADSSNAEKAAALTGVLLQMFNHGVTAAALFCFIGYLERRSGGLRGIDDFGGLRKGAPVFCGLMGVAVFASLGLPGLNGFVGEFLIFKGAFSLVSWATALALIGLLTTAVFLLTVLQRVFHGPTNIRWASFPDLTVAERLIILPATALMFVIGIYPKLLIELTNSTVLNLVTQLAR